MELLRLRRRETSCSKQEKPSTPTRGPSRLQRRETSSFAKEERSPPRRDRSRNRRPDRSTWRQAPLFPPRRERSRSRVGETLSPRRGRLSHHRWGALYSRRKKHLIQRRETWCLRQLGPFHSNCVEIS